MFWIILFVIWILNLAGYLFQVQVLFAVALAIASVLLVYMWLIDDYEDDDKTHHCL